MRKQYYLRDSERGLLAWDVEGLIRHIASLPAELAAPVEVPLSAIRELDEPYWFGGEDARPTCREIAEHFRLAQEADLAYPIILDAEGRVMDGMHRVVKALSLGRQTIAAVRLPETPPPDFVGVAEDALPYDQS